jgi:hypothetical protein
VAREKGVEAAETLLAALPRIRPRLRASGTSGRAGVTDFVLRRKSEMALLMSSFGLGGFGWCDGAGAVDTVLDGEFGLISERGSDLEDKSEVESEACAKGSLFWESISDLIGAAGSFEMNAVLSSLAFRGGRAVGRGRAFSDREAGRPMSLFDPSPSVFCVDAFSLIPGIEPGRFWPRKRYFCSGRLTPASMESQSQLASTIGIFHSRAASILSFLNPIVVFVRRMEECLVKSSLYLAPRSSTARVTCRRSMPENAADEIVISLKSGIGNAENGRPMTCSVGSIYFL